MLTTKAQIRLTADDTKRLGTIAEALNATPRPAGTAPWKPATASLTDCIRAALAVGEAVALRGELKAVPGPRG